MLRNLVSTSLIGFLLQWELRVDPLMCLLLNACTYEGVMNELKSATVVDSQTFAISGLNKGDTTPPLHHVRVSYTWSGAIRS